jgi:hypothetical protein
MKITSGVVKRLGYILIDVNFVHPVFTFVEEYDDDIMTVSDLLEQPCN